MNGEEDVIKNQDELKICVQLFEADSSSINKENNYNKELINQNQIQLKIESTKIDYMEYLGNKDKLIFLFVNPKSGSEEGKIFFNLAEKYNISKFKDNNFKLIQIENKAEKYYTYVFNIIDSEDYERGCSLLNDYLDNTSTEDFKTKIKILVAGGDGTVLSLIEHLNKTVDITRCIFGHIPLGTGNDLSNALGFGSSIVIDNQISSFEKVLNKYLNAIHGKVDVWELKLTVNKDKGEIIEVSKDSKKPKTDSEGIPLSSYTRSFINYFSLGYEARVGFGFEKSRSGSRCWNKCIYFWEGCKKNLCRKTMPLNSFISSFQVMQANYSDAERNNDNDNENNNKNNDNGDNCNEKSAYFKSDIIKKIPSNDGMVKNNQSGRKSIVNFQGRRSFDFSKETDNLKEIVLKGSPVSLVCQNINFYMGGTKDIWMKSGRSIGLEVMEGDKKNKGETKTIELLLENTTQSYSDQKLEFFVYSSGMKVGFEKINTGHADKIYHGPGPIHLEFHDTPERNKLDKFNRVYINIDGEFHHIVRPIDLRVRLNTKLSNGSVNFLINNKITF